MKKLLFPLLAPLLIMAASGCTITDWFHAPPKPAPKPVVEQVKLPPKQVHPEDVNHDNPRLTVDALEREMDFDQNEAEQQHSATERKE